MGCGGGREDWRVKGTFVCRTVTLQGERLRKRMLPMYSGVGVLFMVRCFQIMLVVFSQVMPGSFPLLFKVFSSIHVLSACERRSTGS